MPPKATKVTKASAKPKSEREKRKKSVDKQPKREKMEDVEMTVSEYFGRYRIVDEAELAFRCTSKDCIATKKWLGGIEWTFTKHGKDKASLTCNSWQKGIKVLVDFHFYCLPDKDSHLPLITETYKREELTMGSEIEMKNKEGLSLLCPVTWGVYVRVLKEWDIGKRSWNDPGSKHNLTYSVQGRNFYVFKDFMASVSKLIQNYVDNMADDSVPINVPHDPHEFNAFLHAIDGTDPVLPAPDTLRFLANFADDYEIPALMAKCEKHLKYCHEIPLIERLKMAFDYGMKGAQGYLVGMITSSEWTRAKMGEERQKFAELIVAAKPDDFYEKMFDMEHLC